MTVPPRDTILNVTTPAVLAAYRSIIKRTSILEDRREYDADMLATMYDLVPDEAADLYKLIQSHFE